MMIDKTVEPGHTAHMTVFINEPERSYEIDTRILMSLYNLTKAEVNLAKLLAEGANLDQASAELGIARNTARAQLRSIFAKTVPLGAKKRIGSSSEELKANPFPVGDTQTAMLK